MEGEIVITFDVDWAPDAVLAHCLELLDEAGVRATFFATHDSEMLRAAGRSGHELALHPNFLGRDWAEHDQTVSELLAVYPDATGIRSHGLFQYGGLVKMFADRGFRYESNNYLPLHPGLRLTKRLNRIWSVPLYWMDFDYFSNTPSPSFSLVDLALDAPGLKVLGFHPHHIFMNTPDMSFYRDFKGFYQDVDRLSRARNVTRPGTAELFTKLLEALQGQAIRTLREVVDAHGGN